MNFSIQLKKEGWRKFFPYRISTFGGFLRIASVFMKIFRTKIKWVFKGTDFKFQKISKGVQVFFWVFQSFFPFLNGINFYVCPLSIVFPQDHFSIPGNLEQYPAQLIYPPFELGDISTPQIPKQPKKSKRGFWLF